MKAIFMAPERMTRRQVLGVFLILSRRVSTQDVVTLDTALVEENRK
jgi:hypothetical protein